MVVVVVMAVVVVVVGELVVVMGLAVMREVGYEAVVWLKGN
jgi:hypothetical protein